MKQYTLIVKLQVENPDVNLNLLKIKDQIESGEAKDVLTFDGITTIEVKLEEDADNL